MFLLLVMASVILGEEGGGGGEGGGGRERGGGNSIMPTPFVYVLNSLIGIVNNDMFLGGTSDAIMMLE